MSIELVVLLETIVRDTFGLAISKDRIGFRA
jgi:hypothetical protein